MAAQAVMSLQEGEREAYVLSYPSQVASQEQEVSHGICFVVMRREGGFLLALPLGLLSVEELQQASSENSVIGPYVPMSCRGVLAEGDEFRPAEVDVDFLLVDLDASVGEHLKRFSVSEVEESLLLAFSVDDVGLFPDPDVVLGMAKDWLKENVQPALAFYSAEEEEVEGVPVLEEVPKAKTKAKATPKEKKSSPQVVAQQIQLLAPTLPTMAGQLQAIQEEQQRMRDAIYGQSMNPPPRAAQAPVSMSMQEFAKLVGPPPKTKQQGASPPPPQPTSGQLMPPVPKYSPVSMSPSPVIAGESQENLAMAVLEQSRALTNLVSQMQGDPLLDAQSMSYGTSSRGAQGREKLQKELAGRSGGFFLSVAQNAYKRLRPASPIPQSLQELALTDFSFQQYLEKFGGYGNAKELGVIQYALAFAADAALHQDLPGVQEHISLLMVGLEQAAMDLGRWELAFQLMLVEDPPPAIFAFRGGSGAQATTGRMRAFSALCPQKWTTVALAYTKELDYIQGRKAEVTKKAPQPDQEPSPSPRRKQKFPKSKGGGAAASSSQVEQ